MRLRTTTVALAAPLVAFILACSAPSSSSSGAGPQNPAAVATQQVAPAPTGPVTAFADGTYEVGSAAGQVPPGKYKATVPGDSIMCYWERLRGTGGGVGDIIANGTEKPGAPAIVTISKSDAGFKTTGCGTWQKA